MIAYAHFLKGDLQRAMALERDANRLGSPFMFYPEFEIYIYNQAAAEALLEIDKLWPGRERDPYLIYGRGLIAASHGRRDEALSLARQLEEIGAGQAAFDHLSARIHLLLGDGNAALQRMERALEAEPFRSSTRTRGPGTRLRHDERFARLLRRMGVPAD
ncbi:MAG: tetratricopeptide repeat protein [Vicinamibacterales bacterium]